MSNLPTNWARCNLGDLIENIEAGLNVKCEERPPEKGERGLVKISAVTWGRFDENQSKTLPSDATPDISKKINQGDLLFSRANTLELVGASVIVHDIKKELYLSDKVLRLIISDGMKSWVNYALKTQAMRKAIGEASSGNQLSMRNISQDKLKALELPIAPLAEQRRIADKLDITLTRVDALNDRLARITPLLKRFRQSVLAAATSGRLTEDWRSQNDIGSEWLNEPAKVLSNLVELDMGFAFKSAEFVDNDGIRLLRGDNIEPGNLRWTDAKKYPEDKFEEKRHILLSCNDIVLAMDRPIISTGLKIAKVKNEDLPCLLVQRVCRVKCGEYLQNDYAYLLLNSQNFIDHLLSVQNGSSVPHISGKQILSYKVKIPSLKEQTEIVRRVETLFAFADRLEARLQSAQTAAERLTPALLAKAFRGELVPQDPNDEPAAELLRRLREARAADTTSKPKRGRKAGAATPVAGA